MDPAGRAALKRLVPAAETSSMPRHRLFALTVALALVLTLGPRATAHPPGSFAVQCGFSHALRDDPIVSPGEPGGAAHRHAFYGNRSTNAWSTRASLLDARTTCTDRKDLAAMWVPTAEIRKGGRWRNATAYRERTYYFPSIRKALGPTQSLPKDIRIIGGDPHATSWRDNPPVSWFCGEGSPLRPWPYDCRPYQTPKEDGVRAVVAMPYCWDGERLDSADHRSHVIYPAPRDRTPHKDPAPCPASHPVNIPSVSIRLHFAFKDPCAGANPCGPNSGGRKVRLRFSSGPYYTLHADFWNVWIQRRLDELHRKCILAGRECGIIGVDSTV
jgi:hypothetical protein